MLLEDGGWEEVVSLAQAPALQGAKQGHRFLTWESRW